MRSAVFLAAVLVILVPSSTLGDAAARYIGVFPAEVSIDNLSPGEAAEFELTIRNQEETARVFVLSVFQPPEGDRRAGWTEFPDDNWISFSPQVIEVDAQSEASVAVRVAVPQAEEWAGKDWEVWLGVAAESGDLLAVKFYVRLLVSTKAAADARLSAAFAVGIAVAAILLGYGAYHCLAPRKNQAQMTS